MDEEKLERLEKKYKELGKAIKKLKLESEIDQEMLAKDMPEGVLCQVRDSEKQPWKYESYKQLTQSEIYPFATKNKIYNYIQFPTKPILPWLGESDNPPVHPDAKITAWLRNGGIEVYPAKAYTWKWRNSKDDIVAYRVEEWA